MLKYYQKVSLPDPFITNRTEHFVPEHKNRLQSEALSLQQFANEHKMIINQKKTKVAIFNTQKNIDILPEISFNGIDNIEVVDQHRLLGQILTTDLKTMANTLNICKKAHKQVFMGFKIC